MITPELKKALVHFVKDKLPHEYLIQSREGKNRPIGRSMAYKLIRQIADEFGLDDIGCHTLRKTFGYLFYHQTNKDIGMLMKFFNHSSEKVTLRYIGIEQDTMDTALKRFKA